MILKKNHCFALNRGSTLIRRGTKNLLKSYLKNILPFIDSCELKHIICMYWNKTANGYIMSIIIRGTAVWGPDTFDGFNLFTTALIGYNLLLLFESTLITTGDVHNIISIYCTTRLLTGLIRDESVPFDNQIEV